MDRDL